MNLSIIAKYTLILLIPAISIIYPISELLDHSATHSNLQFSHVQYCIGFILLPIILHFNLLSKLWNILSQRLEKTNITVRSLTFRFILGIGSALFGSIGLSITGYVLCSPKMPIIELIPHLFTYLTVGFLWIALSSRKSMPISLRILVLTALSVALLEVQNELALRSFLQTLPTPKHITTDSLQLLKKHNFPVSKIYYSNENDNGEANCVQSLLSVGIVVSRKFWRKADNDQLNGVLAHEIGHFDNGDYWLSFSVQTAFKSGTFALAELLNSSFSFFHIFGFQTEPAIAALTIAELTFSVLGGLTRPLEMAIQRWQEYRADDFAKSIGWGRGLATFLSSHSINDQDHWLSFHLNSTHPPIRERLNRLLGG